MLEQNVESECSSLESFTGSWVQLDSKPGSSLQQSPKYSDEEEMADVLADAQTEVDRSEVMKTKAGEESDLKQMSEKSVSEWMSKIPDDETTKKEKKLNRMSLRGSKLISCGCDVVESRVFYISTLIATHSIALVVGILMGRKLMSQSRS